jgi:hypothetical protein
MIVNYLDKNFSKPVFFAAETLIFKKGKVMVYRRLFLYIL